SIFFTINSKLYAKILFITLSSHFQPPFCPLSLLFNLCPVLYKNLGATPLQFFASGVARIISA
ncbi:MAG: hypothetical protein FWH36_07320, partial [Lentimicrobiaceae bacterium]|nr:hypothetical protein [Lentimicrobiaceae bacterium]